MTKWSVTLRSQLLREPRELKFGTSGRRGRLEDLSQLEIYINVLGELEYLLSQPRADGGIEAGDEFHIARDLRPSSPTLCQAVDEAVRDAGLRPVHEGTIPTPALANYALARGNASIMVTGSHIPFDWNGYKLNTSRGELLKAHEAPIDGMVRRVRERIYGQSAGEAKFDRNGALKKPRELPASADGARSAYLGRYKEFFADRSLAGMRILLYQHSAVGRDLVLELLRSFGAEVIPAGRSETFVPIDTENIDAAARATIQALLPDRAFDAVISTDGDSDRPLILGIDRATGEVRFFPGDIVGMVVAEYLGADSVVVPISCNDAIDRGALAKALEPKTRIGSPYVIAGMEAAARKGRSVVCGWEANGGFLVGSDIRRDGRMLRALATRDAVLPILAVLFAAREKGLSLVELFGQLPARYTASTLIRDFPRTTGLKLVAELPPAEFEPLFGRVEKVDRTDGLRIYFASGGVIHLRPSGNADEFRIYACADTAEAAGEIAERGAGHLRGMAG
jgi:phosphomannomutase